MITKKLENIILTLADKEALKAIESERIYQNLKWNESTTESKGEHSHAEFLCFSKHYMQLAFKAFSTTGEPMASYETIENLRKIAAMLVYSMELNHPKFDTHLLMYDYEKYIGFSLAETLLLVDYTLTDINNSLEDRVLLALKYILVSFKNRKISLRQLHFQK